MARGLPASPGAASGQIVFFADEADEWSKAGKAVILVRQETSPEDLRGMSVAKGILTARGGMTSHAAVVARGMGKCCVSGAGAVHVDYKARSMIIGDHTYEEGDWISLNGSTGEVFAGKIATTAAELSGDFGCVDGARRPLHAAGGARQCRHARMKPRWRASSVPPESACVAPSTCSSRVNASFRCAK